MRVLVACEYSGTVRDAFTARGHHAVSCDLLPSERPGPHLQQDVREVLGQGWDLMVAHPPCTHLALSGARWFHRKQKEQAEALDFVRALLGAPIPRIALENPASIISTRVRPKDQVVHPYFFGEPFEKQTWLWLKGLPLLVPTNLVEPGPRAVFKSGKSMPAWYNLPPGPNRWKARSKTFQGLADAMAAQWG